MLRQHLKETRRHVLNIATWSRIINYILTKEYALSKHSCAIFRISKACRCLWDPVPKDLPFVWLYCYKSRGTHNICPLIGRRLVSSMLLFSVQMALDFIQTKLSYTKSEVSTVCAGTLHHPNFVTKKKPKNGCVHTLQEVSRILLSILHFLLVRA